jgi:uncharacterized phiE125 gp8 family phage protein
MSASTDLVTLADLKAYLGISESGHDAVLGGLIDAASEAIERACGRAFAQAERTEYHDGRGSAWLVLKERPIASIADLRDDLDREFGAASAIVADDYTFYPEEGIVRLLTGTFQDGSRNVRVRYTAGYQTVPEDLAQACLMLAASWFNAGHQGGDGLTAEVLGDYRAEYAHRPLPEEVLRLIAPYRNWEV